MKSQYRKTIFSDLATATRFLKSFSNFIKTLFNKVIFMRKLNMNEDQNNAFPTKQ